jgi:hypothetical protein
MKLFLPNNLFSRLFEKLIDKKNISEVIYLPSAQISKMLESFEDAVGLIPTCDLLNHHDLFISSKLGIAFDGLISSSYFYLGNSFGNDNKIHLYGDISSNDLILSKILISERYDIDIDIILETKDRTEDVENYLICGDENFNKSQFEMGISFADQTAEFINLPYVNYILASKRDNLLTDLNQGSDKIDINFEDNFNEMISKENISESSIDFIKMNLGSIYFQLTDNEIEAINEIVKLPFYHGMIEDVHELKLV